jgi:hypothetical protein
MVHVEYGGVVAKVRLCRTGCVAFQPQHPALGKRAYHEQDVCTSCSVRAATIRSISFPLNFVETKMIVSFMLSRTRIKRRKKLVGVENKKCRLLIR